VNDTVHASIPFKDCKFASILLTQESETIPDI
jgi:hypothetical protein